MHCERWEAPRLYSSRSPGLLLPTRGSFYFINFGFWFFPFSFFEVGDCLDRWVYTGRGRGSSSRWSVVGCWACASGRVLVGEKRGWINCKEAAKMKCYLIIRKASPDNPLSNRSTST
ncbi:hypothetical protein M430DRAFT_234858 [Amorphotheca resinae ATCC 22711]|uniref:Uncharacterized protein n=1 Tax=Amorphotheca resinae ATCC 22711 TaxID=857342 RepID=A0A2T3B4E3_AMORE|nr:hypothetical protein M430DRAFT_234858 [Amorphotheca resinae ATCC 22711]PSS20512.1 hypothetical protein M430DRAFT_234858 [Amorphotheca resinae ATCC 22711]